MTWYSTIMLIVTLTITVDSILIPIKNNYSRCLMEYSVLSEDTTYKIFIELPQIPEGSPGDHYSISVRNT